MAFCVGLDLGQSADYTALAVVQGVEEGAWAAGTARRCTSATWSATPCGRPTPR
jgi:hypothetical protein